MARSGGSALRTASTRWPPWPPGHTRWATHGHPTAENAHPHLDCTGRLAIIHNGIIENHAALRAELVAAGHVMTSATDTEVVAHLIEGHMAAGLSLAEHAAAIPEEHKAFVQRLQEERGSRGRRRG